MVPMKKNVCCGFVSFLGWTVTSFLCHLSTKSFLRTALGDSVIFSDKGFAWAAVITFVQMTMCCLLTDIHLSEIRDAGQQRILIVKVVCHILATLATNYSMTLVYASSTFAIKILEPITSAIVQRLIIGTSLTPSAVISLPITIGGTVVFCGDTVFTSSSAAGVVVAFLSNVILAFRNVAIKLEQKRDSNKTIEMRQTKTIILALMPLTFLLVAVEYLNFQELVSTSVAFLIATAACSSTFHVIYSYISTNVVLFHMTVVSHSVANISKRVVVMLLLYSVGQRTANTFNFLGLVVCIVGLIFYVQGKFNTDSEHKKNINGLIPKSYLQIIMSVVATVAALCSIVLLMRSVKYTERPLPTKTMYEMYDSETLRLFLPPLTKNDSENGTVVYLAEMFPPLWSPGASHSAPYIQHRIKEFLQHKLIITPQETDVLSPLLTTTLDVINETQRIHMNLFSDLIGNFKYAILFEVAAYENKGDPAISTGQIFLIRRLGLKLLYYCTIQACTEKNMKKVKAMLAIYPVNDVVVLMQGGGNLVGYTANDKLRARVLKHFGEYQSVLFPQSMLLRPNKASLNHLEFCKTIYKNQSNLTIVLRDRQSLWYAKQHLSGGPRLFLAPDMAFQIGHVDRFISPMFDILWVKRNDNESPISKLPSFPTGISVHVADWWEWKTPRGNTSMETAFLITNNGLIFLQRGRVVITDRLHGHILSTLLDIPHVLIDNPYRKLSMFHNSWTRSVENTVLVNTAEDAIKEAVKLLHKYDKQLPQIIPYMDIKENIFEVNIMKDS